MRSAEEGEFAGEAVHLQRLICAGGDGGAGGRTTDSCSRSNC